MLSNTVGKLALLEGLGQVNPEAVKAVEDHLRMQSGAVLSLADLQNRFSRKPFAGRNGRSCFWWPVCTWQAP